MLQLHGGRISMLAVGSLLIAAAGSTAAFADGTPAPDSTIVRNGAQWYTQAYENTATGAYTVPEQSDVVGPQRAPFGPGSHRMAVGQYEVQTELYRTNSYDGMDLGDITRLEYSTFARHAAGGADRQPTYLRLSVDENGATDGLENNTSLFFFPSNNGTVVNGEWQSWDVTGGEIDVDADNGGTTTLAAYASAHPDAVLVNEPYVDSQGSHDSGAVSLISGAAASQTRGEYFVDRVIVGDSGQDTLFDFGPSAETDGGTTDATVTAGNLQGWAFQAYDDVNYLNSNQQFVAGPGTPPLGGGSLKMSLSSADNDERVELFRTEQYDGTLVRDLRTVSYATYSRATAGNAVAQQPAYLRLSVDFDGNGSTDDSLFYYPANNGVPAQSTWQTWNAGTGDWTSVNAPAVEFTLAQYVVAHPDARIVKNEDGSVPSQVDGGVAFIVGGAGLATQMNGEYFLDAITISKVDAATSSVATGTRFDLEPAQPSVSIADAEVAEGNAGATVSFPVTVANPTAQSVTVQYATSNGTATAGSDYTATSGSLTIAAGETTGRIDVPVLSDTVKESTETLTVTLTSPGYGTLADGTATGTITDDDPAVTPPVVTPPVVTPPVVTPPVVTPPVAPTPVSADLVVKGFGHQAGNDVVVANAIDEAAGATVKLLRKTKSGTFRVIATAVLNAKGNYRFRDITDRNGAALTTYKVKVSRTDLTEKAKARIKLH